LKLIPIKMGPSPIKWMQICWMRNCEWYLHHFHNHRKRDHKLNSTLTRWPFSSYTSQFTLHCMDHTLLPLGLYFAFVWCATTMSEFLLCMVEKFVIPQGFTLTFSFNCLWETIYFKKILRLHWYCKSFITLTLHSMTCCHIFEEFDKGQTH